MKLVQIIFSPTGGTQKVADIIAEEWKESVTRIDLSGVETGDSKIIMEQEDIALVAVPSYGGRVPELATKRLMNISGNQARCIIVCVYGNRAYEDTLVELQDIVENCGFRTVAAIFAVAEHSIMHQYATGRPDKQDEEELHRFAKTVYEKLQSPEMSASAPEIPGNRPYKKAMGVGLVPKVGGKCVNCGLCARECPAQAISKDNVKTVDAGKCISCMRCVVMCPQSARTLNKAMVSVASMAMKKACSQRKDNELFISA